MSWVNFKANAVTILKDAEYSEIPYNINADDAPMSLSHKSFTLKPSIPDVTYATNNRITIYDVGNLIISYAVKDNTAFDQYYDEFKAIVIAITGNKQLQTPPEFDMVAGSGSFAQGTVSIYLGSDSSCS